MPFTNDGPYASFNDTNNFVAPSIIVPEGQTKNHIAIESSKNAVFYIELFIKTSSDYLTASAVYLVYLNSSNLATLQKLGGSSTLTAINSSGIAPIVNDDTVTNYIQCAAGITNNCIVRVTPVIGKAKVL